MDLTVAALQVKQDESFPADLLFLASTDTDGFCYIEVPIHCHTMSHFSFLETLCD